MNVENAKRLIQTMRVHTEIEFDMGDIVELKYERETGQPCGAACCLAGFAQIMEGADLLTISYNDKAIKNSLELTQKQLYELCYPTTLRERRIGSLTELGRLLRPSIKFEDDIWGDEPGPCHLAGEEGRLKGIAAVEKAIELWGEVKENDGVVWDDPAIAEFDAPEGRQ